MKKTIIGALMLACLLSGCANGEKGANADGVGTNTGFANVAVDAAEQKAVYYQGVAEDLERELLNTKAAFYEERLAYEARIDALEAMLAGGTEDVSSPFQYTVTDAGAIVTGYTGDAKTVVIPERLGDVPVVAIADRAFENNLTVTSLTLPSGVTDIGWFAFAGCVFLQRIDIPASVCRISYGAFQNCPSTMVIGCEGGSFAEAYAVSYGFATE